MPNLSFSGNTSADVNVSVFWVHYFHRYWAPRTTASSVIRRCFTWMSGVLRLASAGRAVCHRRRRRRGSSSRAGYRVPRITSSLALRSASFRYVVVSNIYGLSRPCCWLVGGGPISKPLTTHAFWGVRHTVDNSRLVFQRQQRWRLDNDWRLKLCRSCTVA